MKLENLIWKKSLFGSLIRRYYKVFWIHIKAIPEDAVLWRTVYNAVHIKEDGALKSAFFRDRRHDPGGALSCYIAKFISQKKASEPLGNTPPYLKRPGIVVLSVDWIKNITNNQDVSARHVPVRENNNYAHAEVVGKLNKKQSRELARNAIFEIEPIVQ